ncbi:MAG TPA: hypothetical protein DDY82_03515, partial [Clostridiales bacterium]|nr:hypothetical protein [Clostridiales bacterium]
MKKIFIFLVCLIFTLTCISCSQEVDDTSSNNQSSISVSSTNRPATPSSKSSLSKTNSSSSSAQTSKNSLTDTSSQSSSSQTSSSSSGSSTLPSKEDDFITTTVVNGYVKENNVYTISLAGDYILQGTLTEGQIIVNAGDDDKVNLILNGVTMSNSTDSVIKALNADRLSIKAVKGTTNE